MSNISNIIKNNGYVNYDYLFKLLLIGDSGAGKSAIMNRYCDDFFTESYISTIGVDFKIKTLHINEKIIKLQIWDTAGQERFRAITSSYYRGANCILSVFDLTDDISYTNCINIWIEEIKKNNEKNGSNPLICVIGNKSDLEINKKLNINSIKSHLHNLNYDYYETSAKKNINIENMFDDICKKLIKKNNLLIEEKNNIILTNTTRIDLNNNLLNKKSCC